MQIRSFGRFNIAPYFFALFSLCSLALILSLALSQPWIGVTFGAQDDQVIVQAVDPDGPGAALTVGETVLGIRPAGTEGPGIPLTPTDLIEEPDGLPTIAAMNSLYAKQGKLHQMFEAGPVDILTGPPEDPRAFTVTAAPTRPLTDMPVVFWVQLVVGLTCSMLGGWVLVIRPTEPGARFMAISGLGLTVASHAAALYSSRALPLPETLFDWTSAFNSAGAITFGIGMVNLFIVYPRRYLPKWLPTLVSLVFGLWVAASFLRVTGTTAMAVHIPVVLLMSLIILGAIGQFFATRNMPRQRAALRWFGLSVTLGAGSFISLIALPQVFGLQPQISQGYAFALFLLVYGGLVLGVVRYRLFDLEFWALRALFYAGGVALLLILDAALVYFVSIERIPAFSIALLAVAFIYLPARDHLSRWLTGGRQLNSAELFDMLSGFALASDAAEQERQFRDLLERLFRPLDISPAPAPVDTPQLREGGGALDVPGLDTIPDLRMSWPRRGRRLFSARDVARVNDILRLGAQVVERRRAYEAGAMQERQRINRDMHDNVGVQLLGALHSTEMSRKNALIRQALSDLREMVSNNFSGPAGLHALLADLRAEMSDYLATADIKLDWADTAPDTTISQAVVNAIRSTLREGIGNILRHSGATAAHVRIAPSDRASDWLTLEIEDNGKGLGGSLNAARIKGNGLRNLSTRSDAWGGDFSVTPGPDGRGTLLRISIPLTREAEDIVTLSDVGE